MNTPKTAPVLIKEVTTLVNQINNTCEDLFVFLDMSPSAVSHGYEVKQIEKLDSEYLDVIMRKISLLKKYLFELKSYVSNNDTLSFQEIGDVYVGCNQVVEKLVAVTKKDASFFELLAMPCMEVKTLVKKIKEELMLPALVS